MRIEAKSIREGAMIGERVWICHYLRPDLDKKPLRNVPPTLAIIRSINELPKGKKVYYSETFFSPINKNDTISTQVISPVDNTGFRSLCGNELFIFDNYYECVEEWNKQLAECESRLIEKKKTILDELQSDIDNINKMKK